MSRENLFGHVYSSRNRVWGLRYPINTKTGKRTRPDLLPVSEYTMFKWFGVDPKANSPSKVLKKPHPLNANMKLILGRNFRLLPNAKNIQENKRRRAASVIQKAFRAPKKYPVVYASKKNAPVLAKLKGFIPLKNKIFYIVE